jgi:hypothetical protein
MDKERRDACSLGSLKLKRRRYAKVMDIRQTNTSKLKMIQEGKLDLE